MAIIYSYEGFVINCTIANIKSQKPKVKKALEKKKVDPTMIDYFLGEVENSSKLKRLLADLNVAKAQAGDKMIGSEAIMEAKSALLKKFLKHILKTQTKLKFKDVNLEVHIKSKQLELWFFSKGGQKHVLLTAPAFEAA